MGMQCYHRLGRPEGMPLIDNDPKTSGRGNAGITNDLQPRLPAEPRRDQEIHRAKDQAHPPSISTCMRRRMPQDRARGLDPGFLLKHD